VERESFVEKERCDGKRQREREREKKRRERGGREKE